MLFQYFLDADSLALSEALELWLWAGQRVILWNLYYRGTLTQFMYYYLMSTQPFIIGEIFLQTAYWGKKKDSQIEVSDPALITEVLQSNWEEEEKWM